MIIKNKYKSAFNEISQAKNILLVTHYNPDGDALSSLCAMSDLLIAMDKKFTAFCYDKPPFQFNFLPHVEKITSQMNKTDFSKFDLIITLDCGSLSRTKLVSEILAREKNQKTIEFDHHPKIDNFSDIEIRLPKASSTTEVLYLFMRKNNISINKNIANCILTGILTDTGNFLYPSTSDRAIKIASEMLVYGARFPVILKNTWRNKSLPAMNIWGKAMNNLQINKKYNIAFSIINYTDIEESGATEEELEGLPGFLSNLHGVKALLWMREEKNKIIKGSLRTKDDNIDISTLAKLLGGGGHAKASGFSIKGKLQKNKLNWKIVN
jgi:bifunctional oligoribonuclease and PAP phosphatase NrnA